MIMHFKVNLAQHAFQQSVFCVFFTLPFDKYYVIYGAAKHTKAFKKYL